MGVQKHKITVSQNSTGFILALDISNWKSHIILLHQLHQAKKMQELYLKPDDTHFASLTRLHPASLLPKALESSTQHIHKTIYFPFWSFHNTKKVKQEDTGS